MFRYDVPPNLPLWLDQDSTGLLASLTVGRGQGTQAKIVTPEQWYRFLALAGSDSESTTRETLGGDTEDLEEQEEATLRVSPLPETERDPLGKSRLGQGRWRDEVLEPEPRCRITGVDDPRLLVASRVWPWRHSTNEERLDPDNGLMLTPRVDALGDHGLVAFADDGSLVVSPLLGKQTLEQLGISSKASAGPFQATQLTYLARHRLGIFRR